MLLRIGMSGGEAARRPATVTGRVDCWAERTAGRGLRIQGPGPLAFSPLRRSRYLTIMIWQWLVHKTKMTHVACLHLWAGTRRLWTCCGFGGAGLWETQTAVEPHASPACGSTGNMKSEAGRTKTGVPGGREGRRAPSGFSVGGWCRCRDGEAGDREECGAFRLFLGGTTATCQPGEAHKGPTCLATSGGTEWDCSQ